MITLVLDTPGKMNIGSSANQWFQFLRLAIVCNANDGYLIGRSDPTSPEDVQQTWVFLISVLRAMTPPRSPADIPSTSSMMRTVLSVITMLAAFVAYDNEASRMVIGT